ncbi:MAG: TonB-dependent receptor [Melioribacteraceae bacterium]|nr:TonB-dependent receptor [Melioribacteraceae bacterium]
MGVLLEKFFISLFFFLFLFQQVSLSQTWINNSKQNLDFTEESSGGIKGVVLDEKGKSLFSANIILIGTTFGTTANFEGKFRLENIPVGKYKVQASYVGYTKKVVEIEIVKERLIQLNFNLKPESFNVGGIIVSAKDDLLPRDIATTTDISSGEIEHYQATNLGDVLDLVPGIQKTNPGINKTSQIAIRASAGTTAEEQIDAFGTKIIIDGEPISNNSNLQFEALSGSKFGMNSMGGSVDLREIPADNLESVSVILGMPSVRYGDFSNGIIELKTKMGVAPHRIKIKNNPKISEVNFGGGFSLGNNSLNYNANAARSERDLRLVGDEYTRMTAQLIYAAEHYNNWTARYKLKGQFINDEKEPQGDLLKTKDFNRGYTVGLNTWGTVKPFNQISKFKYNAYVSMKKINSMRSRLRTEYLVTPEGDTVSSYIGKAETKGIQWLAGGRFEWQNIFYTGDFIHNFLAGTEVQYDANSGEGLIIDTVYNYYGVESKKRSYTFDSIPGQLIFSLYAEDKLTGHFLFDFTLMFGFRYEMYRPNSFNVSGLWGDGDLVESYQGSFFNPRISLLTYFSPNNQLRINFGSSSKSPAMSRIYPPESVLKWRNPITGDTEYFRFDKKVPDLQGYKTTQLEISYDHKFLDKIGISLTAYYRERNNQPKIQKKQVFTEIDDNRKKVVYYVDEYSLYYNIGANRSKGIEFIFKTAQIKPLNMNFKITGSYSYNKTPSRGYSYKFTNDESIGQIANYQVPNVTTDTLIGFYYPSSGNWQDRLQINYYVKYINKELGLWVTLRGEQLYGDRKQKFSLIPVDYNLLTDKGKTDRDYQESVISRPPKWLFSFNVSKSLFDGAEVSFYVNNFMDDPAIWNYYDPVNKKYKEDSRNPELFYGIEFSMIFDKLF